ncbi:uncharacterized protein [Elaeis guineensis]|uniref:uncharacterized protein isoform X9 n=1 Tax=Elaeis guineensis var. tenera TaxID=51953 RepID=UPI003C6CFE99
MERERAIGAVDGAAADLILDAGQRRPAAAGEGPAGGVDHLRTAKTSNVRQLSAVLLRKKTRPLGQALCQGRPSREHHPRPQSFSEPKFTRRPQRSGFDPFLPSN